MEENMKMRPRNRSSEELIRIRGANEHNLKSIDVDIPRNELVVLTGFGEAVFQKYGAETEVWKGGYWESAVFTNAHSEVLTQLLNMGVLGTVCYFGIFAAGLYRYRGMPLGALALSMYGAYALVSFQQVLNAPLLFLALGICESRARETGSL